LTGAGKTNLACTAAEYAWEKYQATSLFYAADLGGFGNKALSLIKLGILKVWYVRNHLLPFETMELATMGWWPESMIDIYTGMTLPDVKLIAPYRMSYSMICKHGHVAATHDTHRAIEAVSVVCSGCGELVTVSNCLRIDKTRIRSKGFKHVGLRIYDSFSALNEWGLQDLSTKSALGQVGQVLSSADALSEGQFKFGTSSISQFGFQQNRNPSWIANIRAIPDQKVPAIATFLVEQSKGDDESGGQPMFGPKIAGNARTSTVPQWLGNCLYAAKEPSPAAGNELRYRLWFTTHVDPRDARAIPYVAKHRGEPLGMPPEGYLEDSGQADQAWDRCSMKVFFQLLDDQQAKLEARDKAKYPDAPGIGGFADDLEDEVIGTAAVTAADVAQQAAMPPAAGSGRILKPGRSRVLKQLQKADQVEQQIADLTTKLAGVADPAVPAVGAAAPAASDTAGASAPSAAAVDTAAASPAGMHTTVGGGTTAPAALQAAREAGTVSEASSPVVSPTAAPVAATPPSSVMQQLEASLAAANGIVAPAPVAADSPVTDQAPAPASGPRRVMRRARPPVS
jgi:hypothetical protein